MAAMTFALWISFSFIKAIEKTMEKACLFCLNPFPPHLYSYFIFPIPMFSPAN